MLSYSWRKKSDAVRDLTGSSLRNSGYTRKRRILFIQEKSASCLELRRYIYI